MCFFKQYFPFEITVNPCGLSLVQFPNIWDLDPLKKIPIDSKIFLFSCKKINFKAGPRSRWQVFAKNATFQLD